jgi:SAM-dependent methyltransferase
MRAPGYDVLTCWCSRYPVVAGIPILGQNFDGALNGVITLIEAGRHREAMLSLIEPASPRLAPRWIRSLPSVRGIRRLKRLAHQEALARWRERATDLLMTRKDRVVLESLLKFYFDNQIENYNYFYFRFGQPRHLVALSFASLIHRPQKPILDLACGYGHLTRTLVQRAKGQPVIGMDTSFFGLYVAKHWIAPEAEYVCCAAGASLPFQNGTFSVAFCSDAFHYFPNKFAVFRELERLTRPDGLILLVWIHNALRRPYDGLPLPPGGYEELMADIPHRAVVDAEVLARYRQRQGPPLASSADVDRLSRAPLLSMVASHRPAVFCDHGRFEEWPHAEGTLGVNPLYGREGHAGPGRVRLHRRFPSAIYEAEHAEGKDYLPETVEISQDLWANLREGKRGQEVERLIEQCVVTGMPWRYRCDD